MQIGLPGMVFLVFLVLKLCGVIAWSWLWVTCPLWIGLAIFACVAVGAVALAIAAKLLD